MKNEINLLRKIKKILDFNKIGQASERVSENNKSEKIKIKIKQRILN